MKQIKVAIKYCKLWKNYNGSVKAYVIEHKKSF